MTIKKILKATGGKLMMGSPNGRITGLSTDSRTIQPGELFIAIKGERFDGHAFVEDALLKGAAGAIISGDLKVSVTTPTPVTEGFSLPSGDITTLLHAPNIIEVKDTTIALGDIASFHRDKFHIPVIGITGSNGKTTTKEMVYSILTNRINVLKNEGTQNNHIGVPTTLLKLNETHEACVLEMGMNHKGEIGRLSRILKPTIGVITNIGPSHLEFLKTIKNILLAKCELFEGIQGDGGVVIINGRYPGLKSETKKRFKGRVVTFGFDKGCDIWAEDVITQDNCITATINGAHKLKVTQAEACDYRVEKGNSYAIKINVLGLHNIENALASWAVASVFGLKEELILDALAGFKLPPMRMELINVNGVQIINDSYNSNPLSAESAINTLSGFKTKGRRIMVHGDMLELGDAGHNAHKRIGGLIAQSNIDILICIGEFSKETAKEAIARGMKGSQVQVYDGLKATAELLSEMVQPGDVLLLKGSRRMKMEELIRCFTTCYTH